MWHKHMLLAITGSAGGQSEMELGPIAKIFIIKQEKEPPLLIYGSVL